MRMYWSSSGGSVMVRVAFSSRSGISNAHEQQQSQDADGSQTEQQWSAADERMARHEKGRMFTEKEEKRASEQQERTIKPKQ
jgi:hypothetical protein